MKRDRQSVNLRQAEMYALIRQRQEILVEELSEIFDVSPMTVRRDLQFLEDQGKISRFHGGAAVESRAAAASEGNDFTAKCRRLIAEYAASFVENGERILINGSDTALGLLTYLEGKSVHVFTNNAHILGRNYDSGLTVELFGGVFHGAPHILTGDLTLRNLMEVFAQKAFLGCAGISPGGEILCGIPAELGVNDTMISHAERFFILADHTKIGKSSPYASFHLERKGCIITDEYASQSVVDQLRAGGMEVICVTEALVRSVSAASEAEEAPGGEGGA